MSAPLIEFVRTQFRSRQVSQGATANASYTWVADGVKAGVVDNQGNGFEYLGSFVYLRDNSGLHLESTGFGG